ncbi:MAG: MBL fold metallo-hydrolase [Candidatus Aenigmarchaeota archaeon]|nr:MBL fold metallo-hydrolase [Candidatus Aenigmarchaeota archaeon]
MKAAISKSEKRRFSRTKRWPLTNRGIPLVISILAAIIIAGCVQSGDDRVDEMRFDDMFVRWFGHASFELSDGDTIIYVDPYVLPQTPAKADYILITHDHFDHCNPGNVSKIQLNDTTIITTFACIEKGLAGKTNTIKPREFFEYDNLRVEAVPAYNIGKDYHPEGSGIGFLATFKGRKFYFAGDTDRIPEMANITGVYAAFLPIGGKYTMSVEEAAEAAKMIKPKVVVPMHYNSEKYGIEGINANPEDLKKLLEGTGIEVVVMAPFV